jgi:hypothetical protein
MERDPGEAVQHGEEPFAGLLGGLEAQVERACASRDAWPEQVAAGIYAGVDFAIDHPGVVDAISAPGAKKLASGSAHRDIVARLARLISRDAPGGSRLPVSTDEALVAGIVGLVGDHIRLGRGEALAKLRPDLVLLALLPYLGFDEARRWANEYADAEPGDI